MSTLGNQTTPKDVTPTVGTTFPAVRHIQWVAVTCSENFNGTGNSEGYAQSLVPDLADVANVTESRINNIVAQENPLNGLLRASLLGFR